MHCKLPTSKSHYASNVSLSFLGECAAKLILPGPCVVVTDSIVGPLYAERVMISLRNAHFKPLLITVPAGESSKSLEQVNNISSQMIQAGLDRHAPLFALGGGMIGDLAGFVAAIFYRGIPLVHLPTTLLAQVDSSIGGKTGINTPLGKNLLGAFYQPRLIFSDVSLLTTLPQKTFRDGFAEMIKHSVIADAAMLNLLATAYQTRDPVLLSALIERNVEIKKSIVEKDVHEISGMRALLNFGHTLGHAIEAVGGYELCSHGEAVSLGMVAALDLSVKHAGLSEQEREKVITLLQACDLPTSLPSSLSVEKILETVQRDKKFHHGKIYFILTKKLGSAFVSNELTLEDLEIGGMPVPWNGLVKGNE